MKLWFFLRAGPFCAQAVFIAFRIAHHVWSGRAHSIQKRNERLSTQKRNESYDESCSDIEESWSDEESAEDEVDTQENQENRPKEKDSVVRTISTPTKIDRIMNI